MLTNPPIPYDYLPLVNKFSAFMVLVYNANVPKYVVLVTRWFQIYFLSRREVVLEVLMTGRGSLKGHKGWYIELLIMLG